MSIWSNRLWMQADDAAIARVFQTAPPLPLQPVIWDTGWYLGKADARSAHESASTLHKLRASAILSLFESEHANSLQLADAATHLQAYGSALSSMCRTNVSADGNRRATPLVFTWCFPAECSSLKKTVIMRSSLVAFEYMCAMCACSILWGRAAMSHHVENSDDEAHTCFQNGFYTVDTLLRALPEGELGPHTTSSFIMNQSQWNRLQRQALPLQLQPKWLLYFKMSVAQRYHMCCMLRCLQQNRKELALATLHGAESIMFNIFITARNVLLHGQHLRPNQTHYANAIYKDALANLIRFRNQSLIGDAEHALSKTLPSTTRLLVFIVRRSIEKHAENLQEDIARTMLQRCEELASIIANTPVEQTTEEQCMHWRSQLPSHVFALKD